MTEITRDAIRETVYAAIQALNETLPEGRRLESSEETLLFGPGAVLDSIALVRLIVEVEQILFESLDIQLTIISEKAMSQKHSPFRRVRSLVDYIYANHNGQE
ncbi:MAG: hypothetical protein HYX90_10875 [Chloroflexi bacterium]|nr:hypothetical protein [Chloroflexota bacterium]